MELKMHKDSLFAILLRKGWWLSAAIAAAVFAMTRIVLPWEFSVFAALPFAVISVYVAWKQLRTPGEARVARTLARVRAMSWDEFSAALEAAYQRDGYTVSRLGGGQADFELVQGARHTLVACKRWKATQTGVEPLRELYEARQKREAHGCIFVATGEVTEQALAFAKEKNVTVVQGVELARLLPG